MSAVTPSNFMRMNWRVQGDLRGIVKKFGPEALQNFLRVAGALIANDARGNLMAKGWKRLGHQIRETVNFQILGANQLEVGATHVAAGMRHFGGTISAPGKSPLALKRQWLTIPLRGSPAQGLSVGKMKMAGWRIFRPKGRKVLMGYRGKGDAVPLFALAKSVKHPASPWFPTSAQISARLHESAAKAMGAGS